MNEQARTTEEVPDGPMAVSIEDVHLYGCPYCGYRSSHLLMTVGGTHLLACGECDRDYVALYPGVSESPIGTNGVYPVLREHPRRGTPAHGAPDKRPEGDGEIFHSRGIGSEWGIGCFVCGASSGSSELVSNIAAFVSCKTAGERVVAMFERGALLDYRDFEPDYVQVKIGACERHLDNLRKLNRLTHAGVITHEIVAQATVI